MFSLQRLKNQKYFIISSKFSGNSWKEQCETDKHKHSSKPRNLGCYVTRMSKQMLSIASSAGQNAYESDVRWPFIDQTMNTIQLNTLRENNINCTQLRIPCNMEFAPRFYYNSFYIIQKVLGHHINYYFECLWEYNKMNKEIKQKQFNLKLILLHRLKQFQDLQFVS